MTQSQKKHFGPPSPPVQPSAMLLNPAELHLPALGPNRGVSTQHPLFPPGSCRGRHKVHLFSSDASSARQHLFPVLNMKEPHCWAAVTALSPKNKTVPLLPQPRDALEAAGAASRHRILFPWALGSSPTALHQPQHQETLEVFTARKVIKHSLRRGAKRGRSVGSGSGNQLCPPLLAFYAQASEPRSR